MRFPSGTRFGAWTVALAVTAALTTGGPVDAASHDGPHHGPQHGPQLLPRLTHGRAVAALRAAEHGFSGGVAARRSGPTRFVDGTPLMRDLAWARPSLTGADRADADRLLTAPSSNAERKTTHFDIHYVKSGLLAGPNAATSAYVAEVGSVLEHVYAREVHHMGFRKPLVPSGSTRIPIYLQNLQPDGYYGYCAPESTQSDPRATPPVHDAAYCVLDNDFVGYASSPSRSLKVTAAHEFFHAIQFGYDTGEDKWLMEGTAVWMEDRVYDSINDYLQYVVYSPIRHPALPVDRSDDSSQYGPPINVYGAFTFFKFLTSWMRAPNAVRQIWRYADATPAHNLYSLQAVDRVIEGHGHNVRTALARFGAWNTLPPGSYEERASYRHAPACPASGCVAYWKDLTLRHGGTGLLSTTLRHLASAPVRLAPASSLGRHAKLHLHVDVPDASHGGAATLQVRHRSGHVSMVVLPLDAHGNLTRTIAFDPRHISAVVVVLTNGSTAMHCPPRFAVGHYSCDGTGAYAGTYTLRAHLA